MSDLAGIGAVTQISFVEKFQLNFKDSAHFQSFSLSLENPPNGSFGDRSSLA